MAAIPEVKIATSTQQSVGPLNFGGVYGGQIGMVQTPTEVELAYLNAGKQAPASQGIPRWAYIGVPVLLLLALVYLLFRLVKR